MRPEFSEIAVSRDDDRRMNEVSVAGSAFLDALEKVCPPGRELSLVKTKVQEAVMWATEAIAKEIRDRGVSWSTM